ncbi:pentapeptide repeat-containing protein [Streptomyces echinatus]|uniref:pentapeptide repeat-containing protein n=1 Tax=Streptomyces echinatus TaxID=67293 RepID=UPI00380EF8A1
MKAPLPRRRTKRRGLRLWPITIVLALAFTAAAAAAAAAFYTGWKLLHVQGLTPEHHIGSRTLFDLAKLSFGVVAGAGALVALIVAYRRQRIDEDGALREATRLHTERFTTAVDQLGNESAAVRLGAVHALAGIADDAPTRDLRQTCIDVLCAYLRLPYIAESDLPAGDVHARRAHLAVREVRHTVIRVIRDHLCLPPEHAHSWQGHDFDLTDTTFDGGEDFNGATFSGGHVNFGGATFSGGVVSFGGATFSGGVVSFADAEFSGGTVDFRGSHCGSWVSFAGARFSGGTVTFRGTWFSGGAVSFDGAEFSAGGVSFDLASFWGGVVSFADAVFSGGTVTFRGTGFHDGVKDFMGATFSGGQVSFAETQFSGGTVTFDRAEFSGGEVSFDRASFSGSEVSFGNAVFSGGTVTFSSAAGAAPTDLVPPNGAPLPDGLRLPPAWHPAGS